MNFDFSDEQRLLAREVRRMLEQTCTSAEIRRVLDGHATHSTTVWNSLITMGAAAAAIPEHLGGAGLGYLELCLIAEEAGRHLAPVPLASSFYLAAEALLQAGSEQQQQHWLPRIASGDVIATATLADGEAWSSSPGPVFADGRLNGRMPLVPDAMIAGLVVVRAGESLVLLDPAAEGVARRALATLDPTRPCGEIICTNAPAELLCSGERSVAVCERVLNAAAVLLAFEQVGGATRFLEISRDYSLERKAFGRQIGSFQALKHKMADIYTANELARVHAYYGAWALSSDAPELPVAAAAARVAASVAFNRAAEEGIEIHGGIGFTWEMDCHLYMRRARHLAQLIGSEHTWRIRLADALIREAA
ncbi:MAG: acyl-CoA/acyl-ACP dehydrogenase [Pseudomonadales bacterium]|nr:acyl-CoA/acyl-ACP dehydrogenase [Pseudomonadales bacterium]MCP5319537.1 acyl-CoA/acyl-ACP dehydrogenase [Pseudomonadales bacterium]MCP5337534.1 acyl-CoA/acyl-ACP dehydrogenase [Pseudomonadales bacterium]